MRIRPVSRVRGGAALVAALLLLTAGAAPAVGQEKDKGKAEKPLVFKSHVVNAPNAQGSVGGPVAEALRQAYAETKGAPLTAEQRTQLMSKLEKAFRLNRSEEGLTELPSRNGTVALDLQGRYQHIYIARTNPDGSVSVGCVSDWASAKAFLEGAPGGVPTAEKE